MSVMLSLNVLNRLFLHNIQRYFKDNAYFLGIMFFVG